MDEEMEKINSIRDGIKEKPESKPGSKPEFKPDFESYLMEQMVENGHQDIDDAFWDWCNELPLENIIHYADSYCKECVRRATV